MSLAKKAVGAGVDAVALEVPRAPVVRVDPSLARKPGFTHPFFKGPDSGPFTTPTVDTGVQARNMCLAIQARRASLLM